jgi:ABC-2 type transport system permease protein
MTTLTYALRDSRTMVRRNLLHAKRYPGHTLGVVLVPVIFLLMFRFLLGETLGAGLASTGTDGEYVDYLAPGIIIMAVASAAGATAMSVSVDMTEGIINRFRTMAIARSSVLNGHVVGGLITTLLSTVVVIGVSLAVGFRPTARLLDWLLAFGLLGLIAVALIWVSVGLGLTAQGPEAASNVVLPLQLLPLVASAFVPTESMPAGFVGVTVRAVRHYHARGLLPEPQRDASGYRRYDAQAVVDLIRIKTLAEAGVPLSRVGELLAADPAEFAAAVDEIDRNLRARIRELQQHRTQVARLTGGESLALPEDVARYLARMRGVGLSEKVIGIERDSWMLIAARWPERVSRWTAQKEAWLEDPEYVDLYLAFDRAYDWSPEDPRLLELADWMVAFAARRSAEINTGTNADSLDPFGDTVDDDTVLMGLLSESARSAAWLRLEQILRDRGVTQYTGHHERSRVRRQPNQRGING